MKSFVALLLVLSMLLGSSLALSEDTGIQIIGGPERPAETVNLDDFKVGQTADISGFGEVTLVSAEFANKISHNSYDSFASGAEAEYLVLVVEILNTQTKEVDFYKLIDSGICTFDEIYQFGTWKRQYTSLNSGSVYKNKDDFYAIKPMYRGKFVIVATLPNDVVNSQKPLSLQFKIGENEFTYYHRK